MFVIVCILLFVFPNNAVFHINVNPEDVNAPESKDQVLSNNFREFKQKLGVSPESQQCSTVPIANRFDCYPDSSANEEKCGERGCCWVPHLPSLTQTVSRMNVPFCFYPTDYRSHAVTNVTYSDSGVSVWYNRLIPSGYPEDSDSVRMLNRWVQTFLRW